MNKSGTAIFNANGECPVVVLRESGYTHVTFWHNSVSAHSVWNAKNLIIESKNLSNNSQEEIQDLLFNEYNVETLKLVENTITDKQWEKYLMEKHIPYKIEDQLSIGIKTHHIATLGNNGMLLEKIDRDIAPFPTYKIINNLSKVFENKIPQRVIMIIAQTMSIK